MSADFERQMRMHREIEKLASTLSPRDRLDLARETQLPIRVTLHDGTIVTGHTLGMDPGTRAQRRDGTQCISWNVGRHRVPDDVLVEFLPPEA